MNTCTLKFEATAFRNDDDNNLESFSASISVPVENDDEVIGNALGEEKLIVHAVAALYNLQRYAAQLAGRRRYQPDAGYFHRRQRGSVTRRSRCYERKRLHLRPRRLSRAKLGVLPVKAGGAPFFVA